MPDLPLGAVIAFGFETWNVQDEIALLRSFGVGRVQIYRNYVKAPPAADIRRTLEEAGLAIDSLHGYFGHEKYPGPPCDLSSADDALRGASLEIMRGEARFAAALGCRDVIVHPVGPGVTESDPWREASLAASAAALNEIARDAGVRFLIENMPPPMFGRNGAMLCRIARNVDSPHLALTYDVGHAMLAGDPLGILRAMGPRLGSVHLHDNGCAEDDHQIPGMGSVPFEDVARTLAEVGFAGTFLLELYRKTDEVRRNMTPERLAFIERLRAIASGRTPPHTPA
jgi:sugar phosphate isomerase/epimerase